MSIIKRKKKKKKKKIFKKKPRYRILYTSKVLLAIRDIDSGKNYYHDMRLS